jgi:hypothetical protein
MGGLAIWLDPFGMLDQQGVVNLLAEFGVSVDFAWDSAIGRSQALIFTPLLPPQPRDLCTGALSGNCELLHIPCPSEPESLRGKFYGSIVVHMMP